MRREIALTVSLLAGAAGCQFEPRGSSPVDPGTADGGLAGGDAAGDDCAGWHPATPFDPCALLDRGDALLLAGPGIYRYDSSAGVLALEGGDPIEHTSQVVDGVRLVSAASVAITADAALRVEGELPLLLVSWSTFELDGTIDAASLSAGDGAGSNPDECPAPVALLSAGAELDGGGGGGLVTPGGAGGGGGGPGGGGPPGPALAGGSIGLRGGCPGGDGLGGIAPAVGGSGGGAIALAARERLTVAGRAVAGGAGGSGGAAGSSGGGAGGGSGGVIWLDASEISLAPSALLAANGGGGGEGGDSDDIGDPGGDTDADGHRARGGAGSAGEGGDGGDGAADRDAGGKGGKNGGGELGGGGGGGGGGGLVRLSGRVHDAGARISPAPPAGVIATAATY